MLAMYNNRLNVLLNRILPAVGSRAFETAALPDFDWSKVIIMIIPNNDVKRLATRLIHHHSLKIQLSIWTLILYKL